MVRWAKRVGLTILAIGIILTPIFLWTTWPRDILGGWLTVNETIRPTDVIVVLGAGTRQHDSNSLPPQAEQRVARGVELLNHNVASRIVMAGGLSPTTHLVESDLMATVARTMGVSADVIWQDRTSRDTWQNAQNTRSIMHDHGWQTATVVTSPYHTWRACHMFRKQGVTIICAAAPYSLVPTHSTYERFMDNRSVIREYGAIVYAWLQGRL